MLDIGSLVVSSMVAKLGVLGGMGPLATVDFLRKLVNATPASTDQDHVTTVVYSACHIPDRTAAILENGPSPLQELLRGINLLQQAGADCIAIPCNTAHFWHPQLTAATVIPILHIVDAACDHAARRLAPSAHIGVLATAGTICSGVYQERIAARGFQPLVPDITDLEQLVMPAIHLVKAGELSEAKRLLTRALEHLRQRGAAQIILGCTEIPIVLDASGTADLVDATDALVQKCVTWWLERRSSSAAEESGEARLQAATATNLRGQYFA